LVGDDRVHLAACHGRLLVRPAAALAGLIEIRGLGIRRLDHEPVAVVGLIVDLASADAERLPREDTIAIQELMLPRLPIAATADAFQLLIARLATISGIKPAS
jgi:serine kinase of HPr protein (carbohydrate metabolism regulator)